MGEYERVRRQVAIKVASFAFNQPYGSLTQSQQNVGLDIADQILSLKGVRIEADDQSYPPFPRQDLAHIIIERDRVLCEAGFVKCLKKEGQ